MGIVSVEDQKGFGALHPWFFGG